ncbi:MAG: hypothetical protein K2X27_07850 [Candidatus Obscuribacterales bacterium]|nr:hypothetical protein [Candidatus Obscuribacterales bacterium]
MGTISPARHSRRSFLQNGSLGGLVMNLADSKNLESEIIDFSVETQNKSVDENSAFLSYLAAQITSAYPEPDKSIDSSIKKTTAACLKRLENSELSEGNEAKRLVASMRRAVSAENEKPSEKNDLLDFSPTDKKSYRLQHIHTELLADGRRKESFDNGAVIYKDELGRVLEVISRHGERMLFTYDRYGELSEFTRLEARGEVHSKGSKGKHGVSVRDSEGRVKAVGECMTVDPWGRFYLHSHDGQYFCLDLVAAIHCERRKLLSAEGLVNYVTAAFARDGFRMATVFAVSRSDKLGPREITYRFYGRDGTLVEFRSEEEFRLMSPLRSMPPGSLPVHKSWLHCRQAYTAWDSVKEYLSRVS